MYVADCISVIVQLDNVLDLLSDQFHIHYLPCSTVNLANHIQELNDNLMDALGMLVAQPKASSLELAQQLSHVKYTAPLQTSSTNDREVTTIESRGLILSGGTTGNRTWEAALHLGSFLASPAGEALVRGKRVIELGAGTGFLSLFCARHLGVQGVVSTDREPVLIENMRECVRFNHQYDGIFPFYPAVWDWGTPLEKTEELESFVEGDGLRFDVALGADLVRIICLFNELPFSGHFY
jgi:predicted nicotinamide N-methyase